MKKTELVKLYVNLMEKKGLYISNNEASDQIDGMFEAIEIVMSSGDEYTHQNFGTFETKKRAERKGRNPQTGEEITIAAKVVPSFRPASKLKKDIVAKLS